MKKLFTRIKPSFQKMKKAAMAGGATAAMAMVMAQPAAAANINPNATTESVIGGILDVIFQICLYLGIVIAVIGVVSFLMSFKDDNAEQQSRGIRLALVGTALIGIRVLISMTGLIQ